MNVSRETLITVQKHNFLMFFTLSSVLLEKLCHVLWPSGDSGAADSFTFKVLNGSFHLHAAAVDSLLQWHL